MPNPIGRPTTYKPEYCEQLMEHMRHGKSFESFSVKVGTHRQRLYEWAKKHPDFEDAMKRGAELAHDFFEEIGLTHVHEGPGTWSQTYFIFMMKSRFKYRDDWAEKEEEKKTPDQELQESAMRLLEMMQDKAKRGA